MVKVEMDGKGHWIWSWTEALQSRFEPGGRRR